MKSIEKCNNKLNQNLSGVVAGLLVVPDYLYVPIFTLPLPDYSTIRTASSLKPLAGTSDQPQKTDRSTGIQDYQHQAVADRDPDTIEIIYGALKKDDNVAPVAQ